VAAADRTPALPVGFEAHCAGDRSSLERASGNWLSAQGVDQESMGWLAMTEDNNRDSLWRFAGELVFELLGELLSVLLGL
jgi:hypothetical protein